MKNLLRILILVLLFLFVPSAAFALHQEGCDCPCCLEGFPDLYPDNMSQAVKEMQEALRSTGYYQGSCTGIYDEKTLKAVKQFQLEQGLKPDGIVRYHVWLKLAAHMEQAVTKKDLPPPAGEIHILIDTFKRRLTVFSDNKPYAQFTIAIGKADTPSPIGNWKIVNKSVNWGNGFGTRWMGLNVPWGVYGIHGTNKPWSIGSMASHGCFRMWNKDVETIYPWIKHGTPVTVVGNPFGYMSGGIQRLNAGDTGSAVIFVQSKLKRRGFYEGNADGLFGPATEKAIMKLQKQYGLKRSGQIGNEEYNLLGLW